MLIRTSLLLRLAVIIGFSFVVVGYLSAELFYRYTYTNELKNSYRAIEQLHLTVSSTASISAYLNDRDLANEVVMGLIKNNIVQAAEISSLREALAQSPAQSPNLALKGGLSFPLYSPFEMEKKIGEIRIVPNDTFIEQRAQAIASKNYVVLIIQAITVTVLSITICYFIITQPMVAVARSLHKITPGTNARVETPKSHQSSELGLVVDDINHLLQKTEKQIQEERRLREKIESLERRFRMLFDNSAAAIMLTDAKFQKVIYNNTFTSLVSGLGMEPHSDFQKMVDALFVTPLMFYNLITCVERSQEMVSGDLRLCNCTSKDEHWVHAVVMLHRDDDGKDYLQIFLHDISKRKAELKELSYKANYDKLTNLLNRQAAERTLDRLIVEKQNFVLLLLDLDGFKPVNDKYGHDAGDYVLQVISERLTSSFRISDVVSRWGGDEFLVALRQVNKEAVKVIARKLMEVIHRPIMLEKEDLKVEVGISIGAAFFPQDSSEFEELMAMADQAMYRVKYSGKNDLVFYDELARLQREQAAKHRSE